MTVLVHSAAGGVGQIAMELCQKLGLYPIASIGSDKKVIVVVVIVLVIYDEKEY